MVTKRQLAAIEFCESLGFPEFEGDKSDFTQVSAYLYQYLDAAKVQCEDVLACSDILDKY